MSNELQTCRTCGEEKQIGEFRRGERGKPTKVCKICTNQRQREWYEKNKEHARKYAREFQSRPDRAERRRQYARERYYDLTVKERQRDNRLRRDFGISLTEYNDLLLAQDNRCAICRTTCKSGRQLAVDHCHVTGHVRGLLCMNCNRGLGWFQENPDLLLAAATYATKTLNLLEGTG